MCKKTSLTVGRFITHFCATLSVTYLRFGYTFGLHDQITYTPYGIKQADPSAFINDWTTDQVTMPHWFFTELTAQAERAGYLQEVYYLYFLLTVAAFSAAITIFHSKLKLPSPLAYAIGPLTVMGPYAFLGSTLPLLNHALPHCLGNTLALLCLSLLATNRDRIAILVSVTALLVHLQIGFLTLLFFLIALLIRIKEKNSFTPIIFGLCIVTAGTYIIASAVGLTSDIVDFERSCRLYAPFHCYAPSWAIAQTTLSLLILLACIYCTFRLHTATAVKAYFIIPLTLLLTIIVIDYTSFPILSDYVRRANLHRLAALIYPLIPLILIATLGRIKTIHTIIPAVLSLIVWLCLNNSLLTGSPFFASCFVLALYLLSRDTNTHQHWEQGALYLLFPAILPFIAVNYSPPNNTAAILQIGERLRTTIPVGETILTSPGNTWVRLASRRAVIAEWKSRPLGGPTLIEWEKRISDLGGYDTTGDAFAVLPWDQIPLLMEKYSARFFFTHNSDPRFEQATSYFAVKEDIGMGYFLFTNQANALTH